MEMLIQNGLLLTGFDRLWTFTGGRCSETVRSTRWVWELWPWSSLTRMCIGKISKNQRTESHDRHWYWYYYRSCYVLLNQTLIFSLLWIYHPEKAFVFKLNVHLIDFIWLTYFQICNQLPSFWLSNHLKG